MTDFPTIETSTQAGNPIALYEIQIGATFFYYTDMSDPYTYDGNIYLPAVIGRTQHTVNDDKPGSEINIFLPTNEPTVQDLTRLWVLTSPEAANTKVTLHKVHRVGSNDDVRIFWIGFINSFDYQEEGAETVIQANSLSDKFTLQGPRFNWGTQCNNQLYDNLCTVDRTAFTITAVVNSISADGLTFTLDSVAAPTVRYNAGEFRKENFPDTRLIISRAGNDITVQYPIPSIAVGDTVEVIEGCEHNLTDCALFNNDINYGGTPFTPPINPVTKGLDAL